jgi:glyoxylase-like metal-dependent hydrolase (beta-lactamase superfamily II)
MSVPTEPRPPAPPDGTVTDLGGGLRLVDTLTAGMRQVTAGFLVDAPRPALIECGPALSVAAVVDSLRAAGMEPGDLAYLVLSHIHLDHAGGAGDIAAAFPSAKVVVSEVGARHLVDPVRLNASSRRVYGDLMDTVYGDCTPTPEDRVLGVADGDVLDLGGGRRLELLYTPGHAKHHIAALEPDLGALFVGDSVGVLLPGMARIRPATPPPDFNLELAHRTLARYAALAPTTVYLAHFGDVGPPQELLADADDRLRLWAETVEAAAAEHDELDHVADTLARRFADEFVPVEGDADAAGRVELLNGARSNAAGLLRDLHQRRSARA